MSDHDKVLTEFHEYHSRITHKHIRHFVTCISFQDAALVIMFIVRTEVVLKNPLQKGSSSRLTPMSKEGDFVVEELEMVPLAPTVRLAMMSLHDNLLVPPS